VHAGDHDVEPPVAVEVGHRRRRLDVAPCEHRRLGSAREHTVKATIVAATNRNLREMISQGAFRADLYYRLHVLAVTMPPLRIREDDVLQLADRFAKHTAHRYHLPDAAFLADARQAMLAYAWPGNVRELKHLVERAVMLSRGSGISAADMGLTTGLALPASPPDPIESMTLEEAERLLIQRALHATSGNVSESARRLGVSRMTLRYRMEKYNLRGE